MSKIDISDLSFTYEGSFDPVFEHVSFYIDTDWKLGFTGRNGRGKTTFLNLLLGRYEHSGSISTSTEFTYFPFSVPDKSLLCGEIAAQLLPDTAPWQLNRELNLLDMGEEVLYRPFETLSGGEATKLLLALLFLRENNFLLIDEPTNHLDLKAREKVSQYLSSKKGFLLVSHDRTFLDGCIDHILTINRTNIEIQQGNFSSWYKNKQLRDEFEIAQNKKLTREVASLQRAARRTAGWSDEVEKSKIGTGTYDRGYVGHKAAKMMKRSKTIETRQQRVVQQKSKLLKNIETTEPLKLPALFYHSDQLAEAEDLSILYGDTLACKNLSFTVHRGERVALQGQNGSGKSSVLKLLCGCAPESVRTEGKLILSSGVRLSYLPQDSSFLHGSLSDYAECCAIDESLFKTILRKLDFARIQFTKPLETFSEGQKKKVLLARSLCERAHLYLWDEPLNYIDIFSRIQVEELLLQSGATLLFVEHDRAFVEKVATRVVQL